MCRLMIVADEAEARRIRNAISGYEPAPEYVLVRSYAEAAQMPFSRWDGAVIDGDMTADPLDGLGLADMLNERRGATVAVILTHDRKVATTSWSSMLRAKQDGGYGDIIGFLAVALEPIGDHEEALRP